LPERIAIISGRGALPRALVAELTSNKVSPFLVGIEGETEPWMLEHDHVVLGWGRFGELLKLLKQNDCRQVVMAGSLTRPKIMVSKMDWGAIRSLPEVLAFMIGGDNSLLSGVINLFETLGAHEIAPGLLTPAGAIAGRKPTGKSMKNLVKAAEASRVLGELDIGQAAVAVGGRVVAVEGIEGTDGMLERTASMRASGKLYENGRFGVLVKTMKPGQEMRVDLPAIGPETIDRLAEAGLRGVAIEAGCSFILEREKTLRLAKFHDIFIYGIE